MKIDITLGESSIPSEVYIKNICHFGQGEQCCSYLIMNANGFCCAKNTGFEEMIKLRRETGQIKAMGDHCLGPSKNFKEKK